MKNELPIESQPVIDLQLLNAEAAVQVNQGQPQTPNWLKRNFVKLSLGAFVAGTAVSIATNPLGELKEDIGETAPWAIGGLFATEALWIGGAALMASSAGKKVGNPLSMHSRWDEISGSIVESKGFRAGLLVNTAGAIGTAGVVIAGAATALPAEAMPGAFGLAAADIASTIAIRSGVYSSIKRAKKAETEKPPTLKVRKAQLSDIERLADIDLLLFDKAYGQEQPQKDEIVESFTKRYLNNPDWMFVAELNGEVEGFVSAFKTNVPIEDFVSWEHSTADGTLEGKVVPKGKYVYVTNMTIKHEAVELGADDMLLANLFANGIRDGVEYGYFISRMPYFKRYLESEGIVPSDKADLEKQAHQYVELRREDGKRYDSQLRMYESFGFELKRTVPDSFQDDASMDFGVICKADVPPSEFLKKIAPVRYAISTALRLAAKNPKVLKKVF